jgi:hypothetical protein
VDTDSLIRFACVTTPGVDTGSVAFSYLQAVDATGLGVRVMPIGAMHFGMEPWSIVSNLFMTALKARFINVVAIEPGIPMGAPISTAQFGHAGGGAATVYEPPLALSALFTVGIPNVAILSGNTMPEGKEVDSLKHYTTVICPTKAGVKALSELGVKAVEISPNPDQLSRLFSGMTPV